MQEQQQNAIPCPLQNFSQNNPVDTSWFSVKQFLEKFSSTLDNEQCVLYALLIKEILCLLIFVITKTYIL